MTISTVLVLKKLQQLYRKSKQQPVKLADIVAGVPHRDCDKWKTYDAVGRVLQRLKRDGLVHFQPGPGSGWRP